MAENIAIEDPVSGRVTIIQGYKPETKTAADWEAERRNAWIALPDLLKERRWSQEDFSAAKCLGFPQGHEAFTEGWRAKRVWKYRRHEVEMWDQRFAQLAVKRK